MKYFSRYDFSFNLLTTYGLKYIIWTITYNQNTYNVDDIFICSSFCEEWIQAVHTFFLKSIWGSSFKRGNCHCWEKKQRKKSKKITASRPQEGCSIMKWSPTLLSKIFFNKISPQEKFSLTKNSDLHFQSILSKGEWKLWR